MAFGRIAEQRIRQAMEEGDFDQLPNAGRRLDLEDYFAWPESVRMAYALLKSANCAPAEVELMKDVARLTAALAAAPDETAEAMRRRLADRQTELAVALERARARR